MPSSIINQLYLAGAWKAWLLGLLVALVTLWAVITEKTEPQFKPPIRTTTVPLSFESPVHLNAKKHDTPVSQHASAPTSSGSEHFKAILETHRNAMPSVVSVQPVQHNTATVQGHSEQFKAILDAYMKAQLTASEPLQPNQAAIREESQAGESPKALGINPFSGEGNTKLSEQGK